MITQNNTYHGGELLDGDNAMVSRRSFLKLAGTTGAALAVGASSMVSFSGCATSNQDECESGYESETSYCEYRIFINLSSA